VQKAVLAGAVALWFASSATAADQRLVDAAKRHDTAALRALVAQHVDVNVAQPDGATALHWVAHFDDVEAADVLLSAGARVDAVNDYGVTPLSLAVGNGSARMVARLLTAGANADLMLPSGETPLMTAAWVGSVDVASLLLDKGAKINHQEGAKGQTALMWALFENHLEMARLLVLRGADIRLRSASGMTPLLFVARQGNVEAARLLLERGAPINEANDAGVTPLLMAVVRGHVDLLKFLLDRGADASTSGAGFTPLHWVAGTWETSMTHDYPNADGEWGALGGLPEERKVEIIKALVSHGADINARVTKNPPRFGINMFALVKMAGATPFWIAAMSTDVEVMRALAAQGANTTLANVDDVTPLMVASGLGRVEGDSLLFDAPSVAAAQVCLELGADINAQNKMGETALHGAAWFGLDQVARFLVEHGADMALKDKEQGQTPQQMAEGTTRTLLYREHPSTAKVLRELAAARATTSAQESK
jgi:ankyrin repeat protein